jgi:hypothetical protein
MTKARLYHLAVVACLIGFAVIAALQLIPFGMADGAD